MAPELSAARRLYDFRCFDQICASSLTANGVLMIGFAKWE